MLEKTKGTLEALLKDETDPEKIATLGGCLEELTAEEKRNDEREGLIKRQAETIRNSYLRTPTPLQPDPEKEKQKKPETLEEIAKRILGKK